MHTSYKCVLATFHNSAPLLDTSHLPVHAAKALAALIIQAAPGGCNHSTQQATAKIQQVRTFMRCQVKHAGVLPAVSQVRVEEACLLVYESLNLRRTFLRHFGLAQLTTPPSVLGHNLPQHHPKAVDINLHHSWQAGHAV